MRSAVEKSRAWSTSSHELTVETTGATARERLWNEHNFVFREQTDNGNVFRHAKGATPIHNDFLPDTSGVQIVPLNMAEPVLFIKGQRKQSWIRAARRWSQHEPYAS